MAVFIVPVIRQEWAISRIESTVVSLRPRVALVDALRRRIAANTSGTDVFSAENARIGNPLRALAAVTAALPDDTYLTAFAMRERKISIAGRSAGAARLINALSTDPELRDPAFDAPVTRAGDKLDLFSIQVRLAP
ncbi:PilN domain-containing protein [Acidisphaera sp. L21]|uniref:PilN domain-containing protein n=1 Tax=Acidisphaera sp. L21 TaxID=1641851 RepID=UPI00131ABB57|nr:PilN domain-containing protein [Acidisphaera sp. L21]